MTTYTAITNGQIDQDSPITQPLMTALRDNPIALAEGATGAPRIASPALDLSYKTGSVSGVSTGTSNIITFNTTDLSNLADMGLVLVTGNMSTTSSGQAIVSIVCNPGGTAASYAVASGVNNSDSFSILIPTGGASSITVGLSVSPISGSTSSSATAQLLVLGR